MICDNCGTKMIVDGNMVRCPQCGNQYSGLELKFGKEPIIPPDEYTKKRFDWH